MPEVKKIPRPPAGLDKRGRAFWREILTSYDLRLDERQTLEEACRILDRLSALSDALATAPLLTEGSTGQLRPNPLLAEIRAQQDVLKRLLGFMALPDLEERPESLAEGISAKSSAARRAALARWGRPAAS